MGNLKVFEKSKVLIFPWNSITMYEKLVVVVWYHCICPKLWSKVNDVILDWYDIVKSSQCKSSTIIIHSSVEITISYSIQLWIYPADSAFNFLSDNCFRQNINTTRWLHTYETLLTMIFYSVFMVIQRVMWLIAESQEVLYIKTGVSFIKKVLLQTVCKL